MQAEFWAGTGGASGWPGPCAIPREARARAACWAEGQGCGEAGSREPPQDPCAQLPAQPHSLLPSVPGTSWWPPPGCSVRPWWADRHRPRTWIWLLCLRSSSSWPSAWVACCWVTSRLALSWACGAGPRDNQQEKARIGCDVLSQTTNHACRHQAAPPHATPGQPPEHRPQSNPGRVGAVPRGVQTKSFLICSRVVPEQSGSLGLRTQLPFPFLPLAC